MQTVNKSNVHHAMEKGSLFSAVYLIPHGSELANDGVHKFAIDTGSREYHMWWEIDVGGSSHFEMYEGSTYSSGSAMTAINKNRNSSLTSDLTIKQGVTSTDGTKIDQEFIPGGSGPQAGGGGDDEAAAWELASNTTYRFDLTNRSGGSILGAVTFYWVENG